MLAYKVKNITSDNDITFIKQVPLHLSNRLKHFPKDINDDMFTINYVDDDINIDDLSVAETVNYASNATVKTSKKKKKKKKNTTQVKKIKKAIKVLNEESMKKIN